MRWPPWLPRGAPVGKARRSAVAVVRRNAIASSVPGLRDPVSECALCRGHCSASGCSGSRQVLASRVGRLLRGGPSHVDVVLGGPSEQAPRTSVMCFHAPRCGAGPLKRPLAPRFGSGRIKKVVSAERGAVMLALPERCFACQSSQAVMLALPENTNVLARLLRLVCLRNRVAAVPPERLTMNWQVRALSNSFIHSFIRIPST